MGKYTVVDGISNPTARPTIQRSKLNDIIEQAINYARSTGRSVDIDEDKIDAELQPEAIRAAIRNTDKIDSHAWKCENSCGCPLTAAGRIQFIDASDEHGRSVDDSTVLSAFYSKFDELMGEFWKGTPGGLGSTIGVSAMTWTITSG
jgi:hypothetical protein